MTKLIFITLFSIILFGCSVEPREVYTSNGSKGYTVNCSGNYITMSFCYEQAGEKCGSKGFRVLEKNTDKGSSLSGNKKGVYASTIISRNMIFQCK